MKGCPRHVVEGRRLLGLLLGLALSVWMARELAASELSMRGFFLEGFSADRGLPQNSIRALLQTRDGYLWIVTPFGLVRFDGVSFKTFTAGNTPEGTPALHASDDADGV
jgi:ligand-binding sensor domain-containing protein